MKSCIRTNVLRYHSHIASGAFRGAALPHPELEVFCRGDQPKMAYAGRHPAKATIVPARKRRSPMKAQRAARNGRAVSTQLPTGPYRTARKALAGDAFRKI